MSADIEAVIRAAASAFDTFYPGIDKQAATDHARRLVAEVFGRIKDRDKAILELYRMMETDAMLKAGAGLIGAAMIEAELAGSKH